MATTLLTRKLSIWAWPKGRLRTTARFPRFPIQGAFAGTPAYAGPEQFAGLGASIRTDPTDQLRSVADRVEAKPKQFTRGTSPPSDRSEDACFGMAARISLGHWRIPTGLVSILRPWGTLL
jgi:hypothetical protein